MAKYLFRVDASVDIGSGHVMRCITLANELRRLEHDVYFICRDFPGHLGNVLEKNKIPYILLNKPASTKKNTVEPIYFHSQWLTVTQEADFLQSKKIIESYQPDWIVVDHYALSSIWQENAKAYGAKICVIDDLADRPHCADILIDQNIGRLADDYSKLVPRHCRMLIGPKYALLRPEFKQWREISLKRRASGDKIDNVLINLGGVDKNNITYDILSILAKSIVLDSETHITVVMGTSAPHLQRIVDKASCMPYKTQVLCGVNNMAELMTYADVAIGAAGSSSWERCCLGLPTIVIVLAENQKSIALNLSELGVAFLSEPGVDYIEKYLSKLTVKELHNMSEKARSLVDGIGTQRVISFFG